MRKDGEELVRVVFDLGGKKGAAGVCRGRGRYIYVYMYIFVEFQSPFP